MSVREDKQRGLREMHLRPVRIIAYAPIETVYIAVSSDVYAAWCRKTYAFSAKYNESTGVHLFTLHGESLFLSTWPNGFKWRMRGQLRPFTDAEIVNEMLMGTAAARGIEIVEAKFGRYPL